MKTTTGHPFSVLDVPPQTAAIHWFGQSSFAMKDSEGTIIQLDPFFPQERPSSKFIHGEPPLEESTLRTDFVLLTHNHTDHTCIESLLRINRAFPRVRYFGPVESIEKMIENGIPRDLMTEVSAGDEFELGSMKAFAVWAKPPEGDPDHDIDPPDVRHLGYVVECGGHRIYFSGDPIVNFADHDELVEPVRELKPELGFLTTHPTEGEFPLFEGSVKMAQRLELREVAPAHFACFVKRTFDPHAWAAGFPKNGPKPLIIPYDTSLLYSG